ncbi:aminotransferase class V-fold PLP-dependent enzyme [Psychromicrobium sp. YIM B11713]|uniref:aminotransferase class V-fold PLP-dependent enzyme n=1 Tax=Psychromicrobium sp. YIM B11713 TaxID=3145233 RepID=UPI00374F6397
MSDKSPISNSYPATVEGPFGLKHLLYADFTASGRPLPRIESFIRERVLPWYANTHSDAFAAQKMSRLREQARTAIARSTHADQTQHSVIFTGSGTTSAIAKFAQLIDLTNTVTQEELPPVVFIGPYEHHSNELVWRESRAKVVPIGENADGGIDQKMLERELVRHRDHPLLLGSFSAASNVTGMLSDVPGITGLLHRYGALAAWDYAAAGPHLAIDVQGSETSGHLDAVFLSPHKFLGGPDTPGVLIVNREAVTRQIPTTPGGGTVTFVSPRHHHYESRLEVKEEAGTPAIIGAIRAGLAFMVKDELIAEGMECREQQLVQDVMRRLQEIPGVRILGNPTSERLPIISFVIANDSGHFLHHNLVVGMLSDLFGIQARGGCSCAGPYGHRLLDVDDQRSAAFEKVVLQGLEGIKPGWTRLSLSAAEHSAEEIDYIIASIELLARYGDRLITEYRFNPRSGSWTHRNAVKPSQSELRELFYEPAERSSAETPAVELPGLAEQLAAAELLLSSLPLATPAQAVIDPAFDELRWFPLPEPCLTTE